MTWSTSSRGEGEAPSQPAFVGTEQLGAVTISETGQLGTGLFNCVSWKRSKVGSCKRMVRGSGRGERRSRG